MLIFFSLIVVYTEILLYTVYIGIVLEKLNTFNYKQFMNKYIFFPKKTDKAYSSVFGVEKSVKNAYNKVGSI